ncbi:MAG: hypothetical protein BA873_01620 [Desulfobulbaceae bacterium C00003063]|nr:MAG: hypothetical protein BA873_01620 [Desulfobulbaceae bacterium C00003063]
MNIAEMAPYMDFRCYGCLSFSRPCKGLPPVNHKNLRCFKADSNITGDKNTINQGENIMKASNVLQHQTITSTDTDPWLDGLEKASRLLRAAAKVLQTSSHSYFAGKVRFLQHNMDKQVQGEKEWRMGE